MWSRTLTSVQVSPHHTTIRPCVEGIAQAALALNLFGDRGESAQALRNCILGLCFRELTVEDLNM